MLDLFRTRILKISKLKILRWITGISIFSFSIIQFACERPTDATQTDDGIPPAVPTGVMITYASDGEILIEWAENTESDLKGYNVYRKSEGTEYVLLSFTNKSYWFDDSLTYDVKYYYQITAIDIWGEESQRSLEVFATPINRYNPQRPRYISINARNWEGKKSIFLRWEQGYESDIKGYNIYRSLNSDFTTDSITFIGFTNSFEFTDSTEHQFYAEYYYKIRTVDKGELLSSESSVVSDQIFEMAEQVFPKNNSLSNYFEEFLIKTIAVPADYRIVVQTNEFFGEFWRKDFHSNIINDTLGVNFTPSSLYPYTDYYWRIITYSVNSSGPNSISPLYKFQVKP